MGFMVNQQKIAFQDCLSYLDHKMAGGSRLWTTPIKSQKLFMTSRLFNLQRHPMATRFVTLPEASSPVRMPAKRRKKRLRGFAMEMEDSCQHPRYGVKAMPRSVHLLYVHVAQHLHCHWM
jgi:hypothetical protein